jgi:dTMP kinase
MTELLLYEAARAQLTVERIRPALAAGHTVICDRFADSTTAYQGAARGLGVDTVVPLHALATGGVLPQLTLVLDLSAEEGLQRAASARDKDRLELEPLAFHRRVRAGFLEIAGREPERVRLIDARGAEDDVAKRIQAAVEAQWSARP